MRVLLAPRDYLAYAQDFINFGLSQACGLVLVTPSHDGDYILPKGDLELVVSQNPDSAADSKLLLSLEDKIPSVVHFHTQWRFLTSEQKKYASKSFSAAAAAIVPAEFMKHEMQSSFPESRWHSVTNGVRRELFFPSTYIERRQFRREFGVPDSNVLVGYVGRLENPKGLQILEFLCSEAARESVTLFLQYPDWAKIREHVGSRYVTAAKNISERNKSNIIVYADQDPSHTKRPIRYFDLLIMPSLSEVQPLVVLEALSSGVPVIATDATPFYGSAPLIGISGRALNAITLPPRVRSLDRKNLLLTVNEVRDIGGGFLSLIRTFRPWNDEERIDTSKKIDAAGLTRYEMHVRLNKIYDGVVAQAASRGIQNVA
jgi:hypothetical protein